MVVSLPLFNYIHLYSNLTDYQELINSGDTIIIPIPMQYLVTSLVVSVNPVCQQGTLYLVPEDETTLKNQSREREEKFNDEYLYLGSNSVIHFTKTETTYTPQVWVTNNLEIAKSIASNGNEFIPMCASPPQGTTCHQFLTNYENWDCILNETSYYWIQVPNLLTKYDITWNFTLFYYNKTDYTNYIFFLFDTTPSSEEVQVPINPGLFELKKLALLFSADENCKAQYIQISNIKTKIYEFFGAPLFFCTVLLAVLIAHVCKCCKKSK